MAGRGSFSNRSHCSATTSTTTTRCSTRSSACCSGCARTCTCRGRVGSVRAARRGRIPAADAGSVFPYGSRWAARRIRVPGRNAGPPDGTRDHRRMPERFAPFVAAVPRRGARGGHDPAPPVSINSHGYVAADLAGGTRRFMAVRGLDDEQDRPGARVAADGARPLRRGGRTEWRELRRQPAGNRRQGPVPARAVRPRPIPLQFTVGSMPHAKIHDARSSSSAPRSPPRSAPRSPATSSPA